MLGAIAGVDVRLPPRPSLGRYLDPGDPDAILAWLRSPQTADAFAFILSSDMTAYGGLVASRTPVVPEFLAISRLRELAALRNDRANAPFDVFGTVMRLAPTGIPAIGAARNFFASGAVTDLITKYANLPDPPQTEDERAEAARLRARIGTPVLDAYLGARARNRSVDLFLLQLLAEGRFDRVVLGQDDAGPQGLHLRDLRALRAFRDRWGLETRASIEPGADELAMVLVARQLAARVRWSPTVRVTYSRADGGRINDPLEFAPIDTTVSDLIGSCGGTRVDGAADIDLFVRVTGTSASDESAFVDGIARSAQTGRLVAVADLTFLDGTLEEQRALVETLLARKLAGKIAAFASWNTAANTLGTALPEAIAVGAGMRAGTYDGLAHLRFALDRYADDYAFHDFVRPELNRGLVAHGIEEHTYLLPDVARVTQRQNDLLLWPRVLDLIPQVAPGYRDAGVFTTLPWDRTFETWLDVRLAPRTRPASAGGRYDR